MIQTVFAKTTGIKVNMSLKGSVDILPTAEAGGFLLRRCGVSEAHATALASVGSCFAGAAAARLAPRGRLTTPPQAAGS